MWLIPFKANDERICIVFVASAIRIQELESNSAAGFEKPRSREKTAPNTDINYWYYRISTLLLFCIFIVFSNKI